jgi:hypothetical protein
MANPSNIPANKRIEKDIWINFLDMLFFLQVKVDYLGEEMYLIRRNTPLHEAISPSVASIERTSFLSDIL